ncbi:hypothetical protein FQR65_LT02214 [Abscondita terminalis]|nr:hypothetical protein FQR65_LT02214 [Abscondita terminalis]
MKLNRLEMSIGKSAEYFKTQTKIAKILGISFVENESTSYWLYSRLLIIFFSVCYPIVAVRELFLHEFDVIANMIMYTFGIFIGLAKTIIIVLNRVRIGKMLEKLERIPFILNLERGGKKEEELINRCLLITKAQTYTYYGLGSVTLIAGFMFTIVRRITSSDYHDWEFAYGPITILNITYSPNYEITLLYQNLSIIWIGYHFVTADLLVADILVHISFQFKMLQNNFKRILPIALKKQQTEENSLLQSTLERKELLSSSIKWEYLKKSLEETVTYHLEILNMAGEIEELCNGLLLFVFMSTLGMLCFIIYRASSLSLGDTQLMRNIFEGLSISLQVLIICYWGQQVTNESELVANSVFDTNFEGTDLKFQKALKLSMIRSQKPTSITAGKFADVGLPTFAWVNMLKIV